MSNHVPHNVQLTLSYLKTKQNLSSEVPQGTDPRPFPFKNCIIYLCECEGAPVRSKVTCVSRFPPSATWVLGIKLSLSARWEAPLLTEPSHWAKVFFFLKVELCTSVRGRRCEFCDLTHPDEAGTPHVWCFQIVPVM